MKTQLLIVYKFEEYWAICQVLQGTIVDRTAGQLRSDPSMQYHLPTERSEPTKSQQPGGEPAAAAMAISSSILFGLQLVVFQCVLPTKQNDFRRRFVFEVNRFSWRQLGNTQTLFSCYHDLQSSIYWQCSAGWASLAFSLETTMLATCFAHLWSAFVFNYLDYNTCFYLI